MHHADLDLVFHHGCLHVIYVTMNDEQLDATTFSIVSSNDGLEWSEPRILCRGVGVVSPACVVDDELWRIWFVHGDREQGSSELLCRHGPDATRLGDERLFQLKLPHHVPWHIDVQACDRGYEALIAAFPEGKDEREHEYSMQSRMMAFASSRVPVEPY